MDDICKEKKKILERAIIIIIDKTTKKRRRKDIFIITNIFRKKHDETQNKRKHLWLLPRTFSFVFSD
jgi:hypothetical protein